MKKKLDRPEAIAVKEALTSLKGMVPKPEKKLSLEEMDEAIAQETNR